MSNVVNKWKPILEKMLYTYNISPKLIPFLSEYAERHALNESINMVHGGNVDVSLLPHALKSLASCQILSFLHWNVIEFTKEIRPKSFEVTAEYSQGRIDKVESVETGISSAIADQISKEVLENMFKLGEINRFYHRSKTMERGFIPEGEKFNVGLEFVEKLKRYLLGEACKLSSGEPFIVCNPKLASYIIIDGSQEYEHVEPLSKSMTMERAFIVGKYCGASVFVDPTMDPKDFRVLLGSSNSEATGGLVFEPLHIYNNMNVKALDNPFDTISGPPKIKVNNSYRFHAGSENSKAAYLTINFELK